MVVYLDVLFGTNLLMDYLTLLAAARLGGVWVQRLRLLLAAALGGGYAALAAVWPPLAARPLQLLAGIGMCVLAFWGQRALIRVCALYLVVASAFAGLAAALGHAAGRTLLYGAGYYFAVPLRVLLLAGAVGYAVSGVLLRGDARHGPIGREVEQMTVRFGTAARTGTMVRAGAISRSRHHGRAAAVFPAGQRAPRGWDRARLRVCGGAGNPRPGRV